MKINKYPDGTSYITEPIDLDNSIFRVNTYEDLWHLNQAVDAFYNLYGKKPRITIPNLIDAQADRRFGSGQSSGLKLVCNFLSNMKAEFEVFHPHNPEVVEALMDNVIIEDNTYFIRRLLRNDTGIDPILMNKYSPNDENLILMSADAGGFKPLIKLCDKIKWEGETYSASKSREPKTGKLTQFIDRQDFGGKDILIIDDICVRGGTFKGLSTMLRERNVGKLYLAVSHITLQNLGDDPVTNYFDKVFTTNSKFENYKYNGTGHDAFGGLNPENLKIIKLF